MVLLFSYATSQVVFSVWDGGLRPVRGFEDVGFRQVVALALLALTLLSATEIANGVYLVVQLHVLMMLLEYVLTCLG